MCCCLECDSPRGSGVRRNKNAIAREFIASGEFREKHFISGCCHKCSHVFLPQALRIGPELQGGPVGVILMRARGAILTAAAIRAKA